MRQYDVITFGDMCVDLIVSGADVVPRFGQVEKLVDDYVVEMGGSCCIFACQAARLGLRVGILGRVGDDNFGRLILRRLDECGVDTRHVIVDPALKTGLGVALCQSGTPRDGATSGRGTPRDGATSGGGTPRDGTTSGGGTPRDGATSGRGTPRDGAVSGGGTPRDGATSGGGTPRDGAASDLGASGVVGDRAILTYLGSLAALGPDDVSDEFLASARHLHHGSFFLHSGLRPHIPEIFRRARELGLTISLDTNWDPEERWNSTLAESLLLTDLFLPNEQEALHISGCAGLEEAVAWLHARGLPAGAIVVVKRGVHGARVYDGDRVVECTVTPATGGDSVGAGDSFDAGFLAGWLRGLPLGQCLDVACRCGRSVAGAIGGLQGQPTWEVVAGFLAGHHW